MLGALVRGSYRTRGRSWSENPLQGCLLGLMTVSAHFLSATAIYIQRHRFHSCAECLQVTQIISPPFSLPISGKTNKVVVQDNCGTKADSSGGGRGFSCSLHKHPLLSEILFLSRLSFPDTHIPFIMKQPVGADLDFAEKVFCSGPSLQRLYRFPG